MKTPARFAITLLIAASFAPAVAPTGAHAQRRTIGNSPIKPILTEIPVKADLIPLDALQPALPCCAPAMTGSLAPQWAQAQAPGGNITTGYGLNFKPSIGFQNQLNAFVTYQKFLNPNFGNLIMNVRVFDGGTGATAVAAGAPIAQGQVMMWTGTGAPGSMYQPTAPLPGGPLQPNRWYVFETDYLLWTPGSNVMQTDWGSTAPLDCPGKAFAYQVEYKVQKVGQGAGMPMGRAVDYDAPLPKFSAPTQMRLPARTN